MQNFLNFPIDLVNPITGKDIFQEDIGTYSSFNNILDLYVSDGNFITDTQSNFYNEVKFPNYDDLDTFATLLDKSRKSIFPKKLDDEIPYGASVLEAGCGTGQLSISLSRYNRNITGIDLSKGSLIEAKKFIDINKIRTVNLFRMNIFHMFFKDNTFDVIISNGVLHHTHNAKLAFAKLCEKLKKNGIIVVGLYHTYGRIMQKFRQFIIKIFGDKLKIIDSRFSENISNNKKNAWFLDQYKNPFETTHTLSEVKNWFNENNIEYLSSIPFDFELDKKIFEKKSLKNKYFYHLYELFLTFNRNQINEGGFFVTIGKKK